MSESDFIKRLIRNLLELSCGVKGKYGPLCCLLSYVETSFILHERPSIYHDMLEFIGDQTLIVYVSSLPITDHIRLNVSYILSFCNMHVHFIRLNLQLQLSEFYLTLSKKHWKELGCKEDDHVTQSMWLNSNVKPVITKLCTGSKSEKSYCMEVRFLTDGILRFLCGHVIGLIKYHRALFKCKFSAGCSCFVLQYLVPGFLKCCGKSLSFIISQLNSTGTDLLPLF